MNVEAFLAWAEGRRGRYELVEGEVFPMSPERVLHAETKLAVHTALAAAIRSSGLPLFVLPDGVTVPIDAATAFEPDALVYRGPRLPGATLKVEHPIIVVEVASPSTRNYDLGRKLVGYFTLASLDHYIIVDPDRRRLVHHRRGEGEDIITRIVGDGTLRLDPPGLDVEIGSLLPDQR